MLPSRYFVDLTQPEIAAQLKKNPLVILPTGSIEQHGPHLPTGTDTLAANVIAHAVAEVTLAEDVLPGLEMLLADAARAARSASTVRPGHQRICESQRSESPSSSR